MTTKIGATDVIIKKVESTFLEFPLELKFKSNRVNNYRFYVTGGFKYMIDLVSQAKVENQEELVKLDDRDFGYIIGVGMDLYLPLFKFAPEIKMFQGIPNVLATDPAVYTTSISALRSRIFTFSLTFE
ncbi:MAG: outer membrane beta-barrel protein [Bacteroidetes bacterium]|nr:outer membrane beta-barrel protein [Bacteroidota bacterium]